MSIELRSYQQDRNIKVGDILYYFNDSRGVEVLKIHRIEYTIDGPRCWNNKGRGILMFYLLTKDEMLENLQSMNDLIIKSLLTMCYDT